MYVLTASKHWNGDNITCLRHLSLQIKLYYLFHVHFIIADAMQHCSL
jgi:hypothetical protein